MKVEKSTVTKLTISGAKALDPITVYAEDIGPHRSKVIVECYGKSWSAYWGGCGDDGAISFFLSCSDGYLANCFDRGIEAKKYIASEAKDVIHAQIIKRRRQASQWMRRSIRDYDIESIDKKEARRLWRLVEDTGLCDDPAGNIDLWVELYGDEWWLQIPESPNPDYQYLCRIIRAVKDAFRLEVAALQQA